MRIWKYEITAGRIRIMYLIANQTKVDGKMLLRKAGYTRGVYREQYEGKVQDIFPVIEFVLYWGRPRWRSSRDLKQMLAKHVLEHGFPEEAWEYIDDIKLHVYEMRHLPEETRKLFQSDMRIVVDYLAEGDGYRSDRKIVHKAALIRMIRALSGEKADIENAMKFFQVTLERACEGLEIITHSIIWERHVALHKITVYKFDAPLTYLKFISTSEWLTQKYNCIIMVFIDGNILEKPSWALAIGMVSVYIIIAINIRNI